MKNNLKRIIYISSIAIMITSSLIFRYNYNEYKSRESEMMKANTFTRTFSYQENKTSYQAKDGTHDIYWAQGVKPPIMTTDKTLLGKKGYFYLEENIPNYLTYTAEFEPNKGYYDYNKNLDSRYDEHPLCYLSSAANLISWWLEQNKPYVDEYLNRLKGSNIYGQDPKLHKLLPFDQNMWNEIMAEPGTEIQNGYVAQQLGKSTLVTKHLKPYYYKNDDGYATDAVLDFFFNGYDAIPTKEMPEPNTEDNFLKDPRGGFFYPLLNKERLTNRITGTNITNVDNLGKNIRKYFREGKGIMLAHLSSANNAHALTVWGSEYDSNGKLVRIFVTDSDDAQPAKIGDKYWQGLVGKNVVPDSSGVVTLTNQKNYDPKKPGVYLIHLVTLDLAKDKLEARLADKTAPVKPIIKSEPSDKIAAPNAQMAFKVEIEKLDNGFIEYEWYEATNRNEIGKKIAGAKTNTLNLVAKNLGVKYYYCNVINVKNGKRAITSTKHFKVDVQNVKVVDAEKPNLTFDYNTLTYKQYSKPKEIRVGAYVNDGGTLTYQWYQTNTSMAENGWILKGETKPYLIPPTDKVTNGLYYYCIVTNTKNDVTGNPVSTSKTKYAKRIKVIENTITEAEYPYIVTQPIGKTVHINDPVTLEVKAETDDMGILKYEWYEIINGEEHLLNNKTAHYNVDTSKVGTRKYKVKVINYNSIATSIKEKHIYSDTVSVTVNNKEVIHSSENKLLSLSLKNGKLSPHFNKNITEYKVSIPHSDEQLVFDKYEISKNARISIRNPKLSYGETKEATITVTAENNEENVYRLKITRDKEHIYENWYVEKKPTCTQKGIKKRVCPFDGYTEEEEILPLGHDYSKEWTFDIRPTETSGGIKYHKCKRCDSKKDITKVPPIKNHTKCSFGKWIIEKEPTCTEKGKEKRICQICGKVEYRDTQPLGHDFSSEWTFDKLPTESEAGIKSHHCSRCDATSDITEVPKLEPNHTTCEYGDWIIVKKPTYEESGIKKRVCTICGKEMTEIIPKLKTVNKENIDEKRKTYIIGMGISIAVLFIGILTILIIKKREVKND